MTNDNFVKVESKQCTVCNTIHEFNTGVLISKDLKTIPANYKNKIVTGQSLCKECSTKKEDGYIALVAVTNTGPGDTLTMESANRSGEVVHMRKETFNNTFNIEVKKEQTFIFVDSKVISFLRDL